MRFASCLLSLFAHLALIGFVIYAPWGSANLHLDLDKPVYEVEFVRLPEQKEAVRISKQSATEKTSGPQQAKKAKALPSPRPQAKVSPPAPSPEPVRIAAKKKRPSARTAPKKKKRAKPQKRSSKKSRQVKTAESVVQEAMQDVGQKAEKEQKSDEDILAGELAGIRQELAKQGQDVAALGQSSSARGTESVYGQVVKQRIKANWRYPGLGQDRGLQAQVRLQITPKGRIAQTSIVRSSGNSQFDSSVLRAIADTGRLEEPPGQVRTLTITFHAQDTET